MIVVSFVCGSFECCVKKSLSVWRVLVGRVLCGKGECHVVVVSLVCGEGECSGCSSCDFCV